MDYKETSIDYLTCDPYATFYSCESRWIKKIEQLQKEYPNEVIITTKSNDYINAHIPKTWFKIRPPRKMTLSDEQRQAAAIRLAEIRRKKKGEQ